MNHKRIGKRIVIETKDPALIERVDKALKSLDLELNKTRASEWSDCGGSSYFSWCRVY